MQNRPDLTDVLGALGMFLEEDVRTALKKTDPGLAFRVLIAANLCKLGQAELAMEEAQDQVELEGLADLYPDVLDRSRAAEIKRSARKDALTRGNTRLAEEIRSGITDPKRKSAVWSHVRQTLQNRLMTINPRFDSASDIP